MKEHILKSARDARLATGDTSPGFGLRIDETWQWPLSVKDGTAVIDPAFFERVREQTGASLNLQQAMAVLEVWYEEVLRPQEFVCEVMERHLRK